MVPIPQTGIAGTLNLSEEFFPGGKQHRYETEIGRKEIDCRRENAFERAGESRKWSKVHKKVKE